MGVSSNATSSSRPMFLSADKRKISYRSKSGNVLTLELKNTKPAETMKDLASGAGAQAGLVIGMTKPETPGGLWAGVYDTLSFWVAEAVEIAAFGPYDEPVEWAKP